MNFEEIVKKLKAHIPYITALIILTLIYLFYFFNPNLPARDIAMSKMPLAETLKISLLEYKDWWPLWYPYGFSGSPFLMKPILGLDSLLGILILIIPNTALALKLTYVILFLISGISMYALMIYLKLEKKFAFISALIYMLNAHMTKLIVWGWLTTLGGYALLPLVFLFGMKAIKEKEWIKNSIIAAIVFSVLFRLDTSMKVGIWLGVLFGFYLLFNLITKFSKERLAKILLVASLIILIYFGLSAQRMIANMDYIKISSRGETSWQIASGRQLKYKDAFNRLIEPIYSGMPKIQRVGTGDHIGIIAFLLVSFAIYKKNKNKNVIFFSLGALLSVFIATNTFKLYYLLWRFVPFFKSLRYMDRSLFLFVFCCSILVGIGAKELFQSLNSKSSNSRRNSEGISCVPEKPKVFLRTYESPIRKKIKKYQKPAYFILISLIILNLWLFNYNHYSLGNPKDWSNAKEVIENNYILQNLSKTPGLFRIQTWETHGIDWGTDFYNVPLKLEHIYRYDTMWYPPYMNVYLSVAYNDPAKFWGILNLKYLTSRTELNISGFKFVKKFKNCTVCFPGREKIQKAWGPYLYENELFLPRAYIVKNNILVVGEEEAVTQTIYGLMLNKNFKPYNTVIIRGKKSINEYETNDLTKYSAIFLTKDSIDQNSIFKLEQYINSRGILLPDITKNKNSVSEEEISDLFNSFEDNLTPIDDENIIMHNFDKREIELNGEKGFLVYSEKFSVFDGWKVTSNKQRRELLNANAMISTVHLEGNEHNLVFEYKPKSYILGSWITGLTLLLVVIYFIYRKVKK